VRPVFYELGTEVTGLDVTDVIRNESPAGMFQGRITEMMRVMPGSTTAGATHAVSVSYEVDLLGNTGDSPLEIVEIEMGLKPEGREEGSHTFVGEGRIQLSTSPYLNLLSMLQVAVWVDGGLVGAPAPVWVTDPMFRIAEQEITLTFNITLPEHEFQRLILTHDFRGNQRADFEVNCDDGADNDGDGLVDCDDDSCDEHPACAESPDAGTGGPGVNPGGTPGGGGCGCTVPGSSHVGLLGIAGILGVLWWRRRRRH
jgi:MYXO-CTERM domain-containing protein